MWPYIKWSQRVFHLWSLMIGSHFLTLEVLFMLILVLKWRPHKPSWFLSLPSFQKAITTWVCVRTSGQWCSSIVSVSLSWSDATACLASLSADYCWLKTTLSAVSFLSTLSTVTQQHSQSTLPRLKHLAVSMITDFSLDLFAVWFGKQSVN